MKKKYAVAWLLIVIMGSVASMVCADTITLGALKDTKIRHRYPDNNFASDSLSVGYEYDNNGSHRAHTLIQFDVASADVSAEDIQKAEMKLYVDNNYNAGSIPWEVDVYRLRGSDSTNGIPRDWVENEANWYLWKSGSLWSTAGGMNTNGDINSYVYDSVTITTNEKYWITFDVTTLVKQWLNGTYDNYGMNLVFNGSEHNCSLGIRQREYTNTVLRPQLVITTQEQPVNYVTKTIGASKDTKIRHRYPDDNYATDTLAVGYEYDSNGSHNIHTLIKFDVASVDVTADAVHKAEMKLYLNNNYNAGSIPWSIYVHRLCGSDSTNGVPRDWVEDEANWYLWKSGSSWSEEGGLGANVDISPCVYVSTTITTNENYWITFNITPLVKQWLNGTYDNYGMNLVFNGSHHNCSIGLYQSEYMDDISLRPQLAIEMPEKGSLIIIN